MSSTAVANFHVKNFKGALPPADTDVGIATILKKQVNDTTFSFAFTDATLRDPKAGQGIFITAEKPLADGVRGAVMYDVQKRTGTGALTLDKAFDNGSTLQLKGIYHQAGDAFVLQETWKLDANNKLGGSYNFATEEASFAYTYVKDDWAATGRYNFKTDTTMLEVEKRVGKNKYVAFYVPRDEVTTLAWIANPLKVSISGKLGRSGVSASKATLSVTHSFDL